MAMFNSFLYVYQRVNPQLLVKNNLNLMKFHHCSWLNFFYSPREDWGKISHVPIKWFLKYL
jgi:hypothetical protein